MEMSLVVFLKIFICMWNETSIFHEIFSCIFVTFHLNLQSSHSNYCYVYHIGSKIANRDLCLVGCDSDYWASSVLETWRRYDPLQRWETPSDATSQLRRLRSSVAMLWEHGISNGNTQGRRQRVRAPVKNFFVTPPPPSKEKRKQSTQHLAASAFNTTHHCLITSNNTEDKKTYAI